MHTTYRRTHVTGNRLRNPWCIGEIVISVRRALGIEE